jgi:uncharacterized protein (TIGR02687 family)
MNTSQLVSSLQQLFIQENNRIVFWFDAEREFEESLPSISSGEFNLIRLDEIGSLELKILLELNDSTNKYLLYAPFAEPHLEKDWLLDVRLYSRTFYADRASILLNELGLVNQAMRSHLGKRKKFFASQDRLNRVKKWVSTDDTEREIDLKILAALVKADQPDAFSILMKIYGEYCQEGECNLDQQTKSWTEIEKFELTEFFWNLMASTFGYNHTPPSLLDLLISLMVTDFVQHLNTETPHALKHFLLTGKTLVLNASVLLSQWRSHVSHYSNYNLLSRHIARELKIQDLIASFDESVLKDVMTFEAVERQVIRSIRDGIIGTDSWNGVRGVIQRRRDGHWANSILGTVPGEPNIYDTVYDAIEAAADLLELRRKFDRGLSFPNASAMYAAYVNELYRFDQLYRLFHEAVEEVDLKGWDILKPMRETVESCYSGWFLDQIAVTWGSFIDSNDGRGLLDSWVIPEIANQQDFYNRYVKRVLDASPKSKVYILISDALRFESAEELTREINANKRFLSKLETILGVLPSYTALGMAALLPHKSIAYKLNSNTDVLVDGKSTGSIEERSQILSEVQGVAIKAEQLIEMSKDQGREFIKPYRVIYVYHNQIDSSGDSASTESQTFRAVRRAIKELSALVSFIVNSLNGNQVFVTADHGFLYQDVPPTHLDKSGLDYKPAWTLKAKKRYILGTNLGDDPKVWHGETSKTTSADGGMEFWIPKGNNRFHFAGGSRFIHGGAMLQEVVVPVISVKELDGEKADKRSRRKVDVALLGSSRKVVTNMQRFDFIQTESISSRILPRTLLISIRDGDELITNEVSLTFDSQSSSMDERKKSAKVMLRSGHYDKKKEYHLVLQDSETKVEYERVPFTIDLAFTNDF